MNVTLQYEPGAADLARELFGREVSDEELAAAAGALDGAALIVSVRKSRELFVEIAHPWIVRQERGFRRDSNGDLYIWNHHFEKRHDAPPGVGLRSFKRQVEGARGLGVKRIELWAAGDARDPAYNGYYTWARFGFNALLDNVERSQLPSQFTRAKTINQLISSGGEKVWKEIGSAHKMTFDLAGDSGMMMVFKDYLEKKGQG